MRSQETPSIPGRRAAPLAGRPNRDMSQQAGGADDDGLRGGPACEAPERIALIGEPETPTELLTAGDLVRLVMRRGRVLVGVWLDGWPLKHGGVAFKVKPPDAPPVVGTTVEPIRLVERAPHKFPL